MHKIISMIICCLLLYAGAMAQSQNLQGMVMDAQGKPLKYASVSLLKPEDSTLAYFGISNASGVVEVKNAASGGYLVQVAMLGYRTYYKTITLPLPNNDLGVIIMENRDVQMKEVVITGERVPVLIKGDTVEYNAGSFKTKPDASVEELLKKMPGVEVDRAGNIKAQGENVSKVFVDGKEFFGNDPKVATRNLPADAINKVQVFDKKSDITEFTGIDDGSRERTINLTLKDGKKQGYFGDITAGGGTDERYKLAGKLYRFRPKTQFAVLGMLNNINRSGFSFSDYMNFSGGMQNLLSGGGNFNLDIDDNMPLDFGQPVTGVVTSGAAGLNYSYELAKNRRVSISYLGNGANKKLNETTWARNFLNDAQYTTNGTNNQVTDNLVHRLTMNLRNDIDSFTQVTFNANGELSDNRARNTGASSAALADMPVNAQNSRQTQTANTIGGKSGLSFTRRSRTGKDVVAISANGDYKQNLAHAYWNNITTLFAQQQAINSNMFRNDKLITYGYNGQAAWSHALGKGFFAEPQFAAGTNTAMLTRRQGTAPLQDVIIDSLSPVFKTNYTYLRPGISMRKSSSKVQYNLNVKYEAGTLAQQYDNANATERNFGYVLPGFSWRNEYAKGRNIRLDYTTSVQAPSYNELLIVPVISGPLSATTGNGNLKPEYRHNATAGWMLFDPFSMTSLFVNVNGTYTHDKINRSVVVDNNNLAQFNSLVNVDDDYVARVGIQFDRPIGKLGIKINAAVNEGYRKGITVVNALENITSSFSHEFRLGIENKKKDKWDASIGGTLNITDATYSLQQSMNNVYYNMGGYAELSYRPNDHWYFLLSADVTRYDAKSFPDAVLVPLLRSEVSYYFMTGNRGVLTLEGFDLLNGNKGLQRISQQNYLAEIQSNIIGQYFMLSFKYRLNKTGKKSGLLIPDVQINRR